MKRLRIEHTTGFDYPGEVGASYNEARMLPTTSDSQFVLSSQLDIDPSTTVNYFVDYFGTRVAAFDVLAKHSALQITARSLVEVRARPLTHPDMSWEALTRDAQRAIGTVEMLSQTRRTEPHPEVADLAAGIAAQHENPSHAALAIATAIGQAVEYVPGATEVQSTGAEAWAERKGVCQDMAHIALGALRSVGIPARYVSGYLHPNPIAEVGVPVVGESHAWIEWYAGSWHGFDPTNDAEIGDRHVTVGRGRDYNDVPPLRGVYAGPFKSRLEVKVLITREA